MSRKRTFEHKNATIDNIDDRNGEKKWVILFSIINRQ